jgi:hypothetical protein
MKKKPTIITEEGDQTRSPLHADIKEKELLFNPIEIPETKPEEDIAFEVEFEKHRFEYCKLVYNDILVTNKELEEKAKFLMGFAAIVVGGIFTGFYKFTTIKEYWTFVQNIKPSFIQEIVICCNFISAVLMLSTFIGIFMVVKVRGYSGIFPQGFMEKLFLKDSGYFKENTTPFLFKSFAIQIGRVVERNNKINQNKAKWIKLSWSFLIGTFVSLIIAFGSALIFTQIK